MKGYWSKVGGKIIKDMKAYWLLIILLFLYVGVSWLFRFSFCPLQLLFGLPCPGCGVTRAFMQLLQGNFINAWELHPFVYFIVASALMYFALHYFTDISTKWFEKYCTILGIGMICFYVYRMIRHFPNAEPMNRSPVSIFNLILYFFDR